MCSPTHSRAMLLTAALLVGCQKTAPTTGDTPASEPQSPPAKAIEPAFTLQTPFVGKVGDGIMRVSVSADGQTLVVSGYSREKNVQVWDLRTKQPVGYYQTASFNPEAALARDGTFVLSAWKLNELLICAPRTGEKKRELLIPQNVEDPANIVHDLQLTADGSLALLLTFHRAIGWDTRTGALRFERSTPGNDFQSLAPLFAADKRFTTGGKKGFIAIWDIDQPKPVQTLALPGGGDVESVAVSADGAYLAGRSGTSAATTVVVWDLRSGQVVHEFDKQGFMPGSSTMLFLPDNKTLVYADGKNSLVLFDVPTKSPRYSHAGIAGFSEHRVWSLDATPDGGTLVVGYEDGIVKIFDLKALR